MIHRDSASFPWIQRLSPPSPRPRRASLPPQTASRHLLLLAAPAPSPYNASPPSISPPPPPSLDLAAACLLPQGTDPPSPPPPTPSRPANLLPSSLPAGGPPPSTAARLLPHRRCFFPMDVVPPLPCRRTFFHTANRHTPPRPVSLLPHGRSILSTRRPPPGYVPSSAAPASCHHASSDAALRVVSPPPPPAVQRCSSKMFNASAPLRIPLLQQPDEAHIFFL